MTTLQTTARTGRPGKGAARKARASGLVPSVVYGHGFETKAMCVDPVALEAIFKATGNRNTVVDLDVDGTIHKVLVREVQRHPVSREILHVDFLRVTLDREVEVAVPVKPVGTPAGAKLGGRLRVVARTLKARCTYDNIPAAFEVPVDAMEINDIVKSSEIALPEGVVLQLDHDINVLTVYGKKVKVERADDDEAADEAGAAEGAEA